MSFLRSFNLGLRLPQWAAAACLVLAFQVSASEPGAWTALSPTQKQVLAPLERDWSQLEPSRQAKWLSLADRYATMPSHKQVRLQARMAEWARMTPAERSRARLQHQQSKKLSPEEHRAKWQSYQSLSEAERQALTRQARPSVASKQGLATDADVRKKNLVRSTGTPSARAVTATLQQASPGATTTPMTAQALPPVHHQAGLPKIVATPGFVDTATLLPKRGPQGAAVDTPAAAKAPASQAAERPASSK
ncbi:MAG: DUF3106 domain-containing protein [Rubrivivax sp.]|nr:DUF3106 domain-containing protein [Rubrivivax sp.]MDP3615808.1 DUF3106 domain-containing protein [Rubrivivax sp.]